MLSTEPTKHHSPRSMHSKRPKKKKIHPHIEYLQEQIDTLKAELTEIKTLESKEDALTQEQEELVGQKNTKQAHLEQTVTILNKLGETSMANRSQSYYETERKRKGEDQILSILQFFYIVRLGQQGLFSIIEQEEPPVDIDSLTNICDQLVGSSLYAAKDPSMNNRSRHKNKLFDILHKLENGVDEPVYDGANTTFKQVKRLVDQIWKNTKDEKSVMQQYSRLPKQDDNEPPTWIVMPYKSMMADLSSQIHLKKDDEGEEIKQDSEKISDDVAHDEPKQDKSAINQNDQDASLSKVEANMEANVDVKDAEDENNENDDEDGTSAMQEEAKVVSDTDKQALASSETIQYSSDSDNWRQRNPRGRGRGGRGQSRGGRGFIRGRGGRGQGKRPRGAFGNKTDDQTSTSHYSNVQHPTKSTA